MRHLAFHISMSLAAAILVTLIPKCGNKDGRTTLSSERVSRASALINCSGTRISRAIDLRNITRISRAFLIGCEPTDVSSVLFPTFANRCGFKPVASAKPRLLIFVQRRNFRYEPVHLFSFRDFHPQRFSSPADSPRANLRNARHRVEITRPK